MSGVRIMRAVGPPLVAGVISHRQFLMNPHTVRVAYEAASELTQQMKQEMRDADRRMREHMNDAKKYLADYAEEKIEECIDAMTDGSMSGAAKDMLLKVVKEGSKPMKFTGVPGVISAVLQGGTTLAVGAADAVASTLGNSEPGAVRANANAAMKSAFGNMVEKVKNPSTPLHEIQAQSRRANAQLLAQGAMPSQMPAIAQKN